MWKLSSVLSERQAFLRRLRESQLHTLGAPLLPFTSPIGQGSSIGAISKVSIPSRHLSSDSRILSFSSPRTLLVCTCGEGLSGSPEPCVFFDGDGSGC